VSIKAAHFLLPASLNAVLAAHSALIVVSIVASREEEETHPRDSIVRLPALHNGERRGLANFSRCHRLL